MLIFRHAPFAPQELRDAFEKHVLLSGNEVTANARETLQEIETQGRDCRPGAYGRKLQFNDPDFPPDNSSVGNTQCQNQLANQWKVRSAALSHRLLRRTESTIN